MFIRRNADRWLESKYSSQKNFPGLDGIIYKILDNLPDNAKNLSTAVNKIIRLGEEADVLKVTVLVAINKPAKPDKYRPTSII